MLFRQILPILVGFAFVAPALSRPIPNARDDFPVVRALFGDALLPRTIKIKPIQDRIIIKPAPKDQTTKSGIIIPDTAKEKPQEGVVVAVGPGRKSTRSTDDGTVVDARGVARALDDDALLPRTIKIKPIHDRILIKPAPKDQTTASGIVIPDTAKEKPQRARSWQ